MTDNKRLHKRINKPITMQFCIADVFPRKWDMSNIENISVGGIKFTASVNFQLNNKIIKLQIKMPEIAPKVLELTAAVLSAVKRSNMNVLDVRAKFVDVSGPDKESLLIIEKIIEWQGQNKN